MNKKKLKIFKLIILILVIMLLIGITAYLVPTMKDISTAEGRLKFKNTVKDTGIIGMLTLFGLQFAQVFLFILPGEPIEILSGMCYGALGGYLFITISVFIITAFIFFLVRILGRKFVYEFCNKEKVEKLNG